ncbi:unnamed protein product [Acanthosepion pharaonis]|uniref:Uncharacterized protein n=1 Tax=Acanthosepion pharaonis TaxID=158019 RepID=A0A812AQH7_ACAPH|nr:unnamed protein product [Sepia pharaonis]
MLFHSSLAARRTDDDDIDINSFALFLRLLLNFFLSSLTFFLLHFVAILLSFIASLPFFHTFFIHFYNFFSFLAYFFRSFILFSSLFFFLFSCKLIIFLSFVGCFISIHYCRFPFTFITYIHLFRPFFLAFPFILHQFIFSFPFPSSFRPTPFFLSFNIFNSSFLPRNIFILLSILHILSFFALSHTTSLSFFLSFFLSFIFYQPTTHLIFGFSKSY